MLHIKRFQIILASQVNKFYDNSIETTRRNNFSKFNVSLPLLEQQTTKQQILLFENLVADKQNNCILYIFEVTIV